jgi:protein involved in polysaccharide export with SLBB domain
VVHAGFYAVPPGAPLADALMAAGGTTAHVDLRKLRIERGGDPERSGSPQAGPRVTSRTLEELALEDGDQITIPRRREAGLQDNLRFLWVIVSLAGGIYGLTRVF